MSPHAGPDERARGAEAVVRRLGYCGVAVEVAGHENEVALLHVPPELFDVLLGEAAADLACRIKALGFRYVAVDLAPTS